MFQVSIILPVYNESACIAQTLDAVWQYAIAHPHYQFIFVDDGSTDASHAILQPLIATLDSPQIKLISYTPNQGKGFAIKQGLKVCEGEYIGFIDSDLAYSLEHLEFLVNQLEIYDVVIGSRTLIATGWTKFHRRLIGQIFNWICRQVLSLPFRDMQAGIKGFRRAIATDLFQRLAIRRFAFDVELLYLARKRGYSIGEIPAIVSESHLTITSNVNLMRDSLEMLLNLIQILWKDGRGSYD